MNHKRKRCKNRRSGCLMCKPWKINGAKLKEKLKHSEQLQIESMKDQIEENFTK